LDASAGEGGRLFFLVNLPWIVKSIKNNVWENEEEYLFVSVGERVVEDLETAPEEMTSFVFSFFNSSQSPPIILHDAGS